MSVGRKTTMILRGLLALLGCAALLLSAHPALAGGGCLVPTAGYLVHLGGNAGRLEDAPSFGGRLEYNFSSRHVRAVGLVYSFSRPGFTWTSTSACSATASGGTGDGSTSAAR
jgi:hypothetical protein